MKKVLVLGATGSVGTSVLAVVRDHPDRFAVAGLAAGRGGEALAALAREFPDAAVAFRDGDAGAFRRLCGRGDGPVLTGANAAEELVDAVDADICAAAISGTAGLGSAFAAARRGMRILLANKEVLVSAGTLFLAAAKAGGAEVIPLDSEHCALFQCLDGREPASVERLIVTASGGPFRNWSADAMTRATVEDALRHPVWKMGPKISIDSATMANKALEVIEAHHLFGLPFDRLDVLVHPEALVHGLVEFVDGSLLAQIGLTHMCCSASFGLFYPEREKCPRRRLNLAEIRQLNFEPPDERRFPMLRLGIEAGKRGMRWPAVFNAANEAAVEGFLARRLTFGDIVPAVEAALVAHGDGALDALPDVEEAHCLARACVDGWMRRKTSR